MTTSTMRENRSRGMLGTVGYAALLSALIPATAFAQTATPADPQAAAAGVEEAPTEDIVVTGIRASLERAIDVSATPDVIVDSIASEDLGKFPDSKRR